MATDPYHTFASELRSSLVSAQALAQTYTRALSRGGGAGAAQRDAQRSAHDDLLDALEALQSDVQDVRASVAVVSKSPERFGLSAGELEERKRFVRECDEEIEVSLSAVALGLGEDRRLTLLIMQKLNRVAGNRPPSGRDQNDMEEGRASGLGDDEPIEAFEREQQQVSMAREAGV